MSDGIATHVLTVSNLTEYFRDALDAALAHQRASVDVHAAHYVVNLLTLYARAEQLHDGMPASRRLQPLALMLKEALDAPTATGREHALQRLGDISLFVAGFFAHGFERRLVDVDYHIAMGGRAYSSLADALAHGRQRARAPVFAELAAKFRQLTDALGEISDCARVWSQRDVLRVYEIWLKTGSRRARGLLQQLGVSAAPVTLRAH